MTALAASAAERLTFPDTPPQLIQAQLAVSLPAALAAAKKEWEANDLTKGNAFPATKLSPRKLREEGPFDSEVARKKADKKAERDMNRDFDKNADKKGGASRAKPSEKELEKLARQAQKDELAASAAELVRKQLEQLTTAAK